MAFVTITAPGAGTAFHGDSFGGAFYPSSGMFFGAEGTKTPVSAAAPLPVTLGLTDAQLRAAGVPVTLASQPLPTGASTEVTLAALNAKLAALEAGRAPVAVQPVATTTRAYDYSAGQRITSVTAQTRSTVINASEVMLHAAARCFFRVGDSSVAASVAAGSVPLEAGEKFHLRLTSGQFVSVIRDTADGFLSIVPVA